MDWTEYDIPAFTPVSLEVLQCQQVAGGTCDWVDLPVDLIPHPTFENRYDISIDVNYLNSPPMPRSGGHISFIEQTPPGCDPEFDCIEENLLPSIKLVQQDAGYEGIYCPEDCKTAAITSVPTKDEDYLYNINNVCFNKQMQAWWFNLDSSHSFIFNYVMEFCAENVIGNGREILEDYTEFPPEYGCDDIIKDIKAHYSYGTPGAHYILKDIIMKHEEEHKKDFQVVIDDWKDVLDDELLEDLKICEDFNTKEEAEDYWEDKIKKTFTKWRSAIIGLSKSSTYNWSWSDPVKRREYEIETNNKIYFYVHTQLWLAELDFGCNPE